MKGGADLEITNEKGITPLRIAAMNNHLEVVQLLVSNGADLARLNEGPERPLDLAVSRFQFKLLKYLLQIGCKPRKEENLPVVQALCQNLSDIEIPNEKRIQGIHELAKRGLYREIGYLLQLGQDVNAKNKNKNTSLHFAASKGFLSTVEFLIENGAQVCLVPYEHITT